MEAKEIEEISSSAEEKELQISQEELDKKVSFILDL